MQLTFQTESVSAPKHYFCGRNDWRFVKRQKALAFICRVYIHGDYGLALCSEAAAKWASRDRSEMRNCRVARLVWPGAHLPAFRRVRCATSAQESFFWRGAGARLVLGTCHTTYPCRESLYGGKQSRECLQSLGWCVVQ